MKETRLEKELQKQKVHVFLRLGIIGLGVVPFLAVTETTVLFCLFCFSIALVVAAVI